MSVIISTPVNVKILHQELERNCCNTVFPAILLLKVKIFHDEWPWMVATKYLPLCRVKGADSSWPLGKKWLEQNLHHFFHTIKRKDSSQQNGNKMFSTISTLQKVMIPHNELAKNGQKWP